MSSININYTFGKKKAEEKRLSDERRKELRQILNNAYQSGKISSSAFQVGQQEIQDTGTLSNIEIPGVSTKTANLEKESRRAWSYDPEKQTFVEGPEIGERDIVMRGSAKRGLGETDNKKIGGLSAMERRIAETRLKRYFDVAEFGIENVPDELRDQAIRAASMFPEQVDIIEQEVTAQKKSSGFLGIGAKPEVKEKKKFPVLREKIESPDEQNLSEEISNLQEDMQQRSSVKQEIEKETLPVEHRPSKSNSVTVITSSGKTYVDIPFENLQRVLQRDPNAKIFNMTGNRIR